MKHIPGVDMSSGSLGQGISAAVGMATFCKIDAMKIIVYIRCLEMVRSRKVRYGRHAMFAGHRKAGQPCSNR